MASEGWLAEQPDGGLLVKGVTGLDIMEVTDGATGAMHVHERSPASFLEIPRVYRAEFNAIARTS